MGDKGNNYNETHKALETKEKVCCFVATPGVQFASTTVSTFCDSCKQVTRTQVEAKWNIKSYICCYYYGSCWWCYQTLKGKDYTMKDGLHTCDKCQANIADYKSCE